MLHFLKALLIFSISANAVVLNSLSSLTETHGAIYYCIRYCNSEGRTIMKE